MNTQNTQNTSSEGAAQAQDPAEQFEGRPLGYWLRTVDRLLAERFDRAFEGEGLTRGDWRRMYRIDGTAPGKRFDSTVPGGRYGGRDACRGDAGGWRHRRGGPHPQTDDPDHAPDHGPHYDRAARRAGKLRRLSERGWIAEADGVWSLTGSGREAKERLGAEVRGIRKTVAEAVTPEDYATTVRSLERIAVALGWDPEAPIRPARGRGRKHPRWGSAGGSRGRGPAE